MKKLSPQQAVITFDLHGVLFTTDYRQFLSVLWHSPHIIVFIMHALRPTIWFKCFQLWLKSSPIEHYIMDLTTHWPRLVLCRNTLIALANAQKPNTNMIALVHTLKKLGYELHIFSNIGTTILADLSTKFPDILALFDHTFTTSAHRGYPSKRNIGFFSLYMHSHPSLLYKKIVFIDNCRKNIKLGLANDMIVILAKNSFWVEEQLRSYIYIE